MLCFFVFFISMYLDGRVAVSDPRFQSLQNSIPSEEDTDDADNLPDRLNDRRVDDSFRWQEERDDNQHDRKECQPYRR